MTMKKLCDILGIISGSFTGVFIGTSLFQVYDYKAHPELYAARSAPWYMSIVSVGVMTAIVVAVCLTLRFLIKRKLR